MSHWHQRVFCPGNWLDIVSCITWRSSCVSYVMCLPSIQYVTAQTISGTGALRLAGIFLVSQVQLVLEPTLPLFFPLPLSFLLPPSHSPTSLFLSHSFLSMLHPSPPILTTLQHLFSLSHSKSSILTLKPSISLTPHGPITHLSSGRPGHFLHTMGKSWIL